MRNVMAIDNGKIIGIQSAASGVSYDNTNSGLNSTNVQDAINEVCDDLSDKVDKVAGKGLSTNDYDDTAKGIVDGVTSALAGKVDTSLVGSSNGVAELDSNGRVPSSQLPSYVDDVLEYADLAHFPATGETGKIYIAEDTNKTYRWSGSNYAEISESLALGETSSTAYAGNKGKANADAIAAMKDGTNIDSFGDVETALVGKANSSDLGDKSNLTTTDKSSAVGAINELKSGLTNVETLQTLEPDTLSNGNITIKQNCGVKFVICHNMILKNPLSAGGTVELCAAGAVLNPPTEDTVFPLYAKSSGNVIAPVNVVIKSDGSIIVTNFATVSTKLYGNCTGAYI